MVRVIAKESCVGSIQVIALKDYKLPPFMVKRLVVLTVLTVVLLKQDQIVV